MNNKESYKKNHLPVISKLYNLSPVERHAELAKKLKIKKENFDVFTLKKSLSLDAADKMIENSIGVFSMPIGVVPNLVVDKRHIIVPMVTEEPSIIAACCRIAKITSQESGFETESDPPLMIGQIQLLGVKNAELVKKKINENSRALVIEANGFCKNMVQRGGGCVSLEAKIIPRVASKDTKMLVVNIVINCCDAMGANVVNTVVEGLAPKIKSITKGDTLLKILSNFSDKRLARAYCEISLLAIGEEIARKIVLANEFANRDQYRACTHNKGLMNGIDAVAIATGNDWRAIEAAAHTYASRTGRYLSLTEYRIDKRRKILKCFLEMPMAVGVIGGSTKTNPAIKMCLEMLGCFGKNAQKLARLMTAVGLAQNIGALYALVSEGIQKGHMALHGRKEPS